MEENIGNEAVTEELKHLWKVWNIILAAGVALPAGCLLKVGIYNAETTIQKPVLENGCHNST